MILLGVSMLSIRLQYKSLFAEDPKVANHLRIYLDQNLDCNERLNSLSYLITSVEQNEASWLDFKEHIIQILDNPSEERCVKFQGLNDRLYHMAKGPEHIHELFYDDNQELSKNIERIGILIEVFTEHRDLLVVPELYKIMDMIIDDPDLIQSDHQWQTMLGEIGRSLAKINPPLATQEILKRYDNHRKLGRKVLESYVMHLYRRYALDSIFKLSPDERGRFTSLIVRPLLERSEDAYFVLSMLILAADSEIDLKDFLEQYKRSYGDEMTQDRRIFIAEFEEKLELIKTNAKEIEQVVKFKKNKDRQDVSSEPNILDLFYLFFTFGLGSTDEHPKNLSQKISKTSTDFSASFNKWILFAEHAQD